VTISPLVRLEGLDDELRMRLSRLGEVQAIEPGQKLIEKGAAETHLFIVEEGRVAVLDGSGRAMEEHPAGDLVGEFAFIENTPRTRDVVVSESGRVRRIDRQELLASLSDDPVQLESVLKALGSLRDRRREEGSLGDPRAYVEGLQALSLTSRGVRHGYLEALRGGTLPDLRWALADFATHYAGYSNHFPRYLSTTIGRLEAHEDRAALLENLTEESGQYSQEDLEEIASYDIDPSWIVGVPHPILFRRFQEAVGGRVQARSAEADQVVCWRDLFLCLLSQGSAAEAIGALGLGTESIVSEIYKPFVSALEGLDLEPADTVFFPLHTLVDDHHQETLMRIAASLAESREGRRDLRLGMLKALNLRSSFWDWLWARALDPGKAESVA